MRSNLVLLSMLSPLVSATNTSASSTYREGSREGKEREWGGDGEGIEREWGGKGEGMGREWGGNGEGMGREWGGKRERE